MTQSIFTPLYLANSFVDQVQDAKNKAVDTFVLDDKMRAPIKSFVEAQRAFTKEVNRSILEFAEHAANSTKEFGEKSMKSLKTL
jgi:hypothetical protein